MHSCLFNKSTNAILPSPISISTNLWRLVFLIFIFSSDKEKLIIFKVFGERQVNGSAHGIVQML